MSSTSTQPIADGRPAQVDVRGPRFAAWVTTALLIVTLLVAGISEPAAGA
ncbi:integral membrane protein [Mycolicibacterium conceptionense]|nr:integral membrane protein [Mycolicibacterium conceptionense]